MTLAENILSRAQNYGLVPCHNVKTAKARKHRGGWVNLCQLEFFPTGIHPICRFFFL